MRIKNAAAWAVVYWRFQILNEGAAAPDIQRLRAMADGQNGLLEGEGILSYNRQEICFMNVKKLQKLVSEN